MVSAGLETGLWSSRSAFERLDLVFFVSSVLDSNFWYSGDLIYTGKHPSRLCSPCPIPIWKASSVVHAADQALLWCVEAAEAGT